MTEQQVTTVEQIVAIAREEGYGWTVESALNYASDPESAAMVAESLVHRVDIRLAPGSETGLLGDALYALRHQAPIADTLRWWLRAYTAYEVAIDKGTEAEAEFTDALFEGRMDFSA